MKHKTRISINKILSSTRSLSYLLYQKHCRISETRLIANISSVSSLVHLYYKLIYREQCRSLSADI